MAVDVMGTSGRAKRSRDAVSNGSRLLPGVDGRTRLAKRYREISSALVSDLGGLSEVSEAKLQLCRRFAAASVLSERMEAEPANGKAIDLAEHFLLVSSLVRLSGRLGIDRVPRDATDDGGKAVEFSRTVRYGHYENGVLVIDGEEEDPHGK